MKRIFLLVAALLLVAGPASSGSLTLTGVGGPPASVASLTWHVPTGNSALITGTPSLPVNTSNINIGTATSDRVVVVCIAYQYGGTGYPLSSVVIDPSGANISATLAVTNKAAETGYTNDIWFANVPTGTSVPIRLNVAAGSGTLTNAVVTVGYLTGSATASVSSSVNTNPPAYYSTEYDSPSYSVTVGTGNVAIISGAADYAAVYASTWVGTTNSSPDTEVDNGIVIGTLTHATISGTVTETMVNGGHVAGWASATFGP
jgi:hypothetical protein